MTSHPASAFAATLALALVAPLAAQDAPATPGAVIAAADDSEWTRIVDDDLVVMDLAPDAAGHPRRVVIQLIGDRFGQGWADNIRTLARQHWYDGTNVYRVQDNYVVQWGGEGVGRTAPEGLDHPDEEEYEAWIGVQSADQRPGTPGFAARPYTRLSPDWIWNYYAPAFHDSDPYAEAVFYSNGFPYGARVAQTFADNGDVAVHAWPLHCYGAVGVSRDLSPDTGTGTDLYTVIGHAPRHLDRNIAVVGRIIDGMEHLSALPRGHGDLGFYDEDEAGLRVPIVAVRLASDMPEAARPHYEYLADYSESFERYLALRANRNDDFYRVPAGGVDICNAPVPVRRMAE